MNLKKRIEAAKEKRGYSLLAQKAIIEKIAEKLSTIEAGAEQNRPIEEVKSEIESLGINALLLSGKRADAFAEKAHTHGIYQEKDEAEEWREKISLDITAFIENFTEELEKHAEAEQSILLKSSIIQENVATLKNRLDKKAEELKKELEDLYHGNLKGLRWSEAGHVIDTDIDLKDNTIKNLKDPEKPKDAANKKYVDKMSQQSAIRFMGGGGIHVGATPPEPMENRLWVQIG